MKKLFEKGSEGEMDPIKRKAKMNVVNELREMAKGMMGNELGNHMEGMKKVTVASPNKEGLKEGLQHAEGMIGDEESSEHESAESPEFEAGEQEESVEHEMQDLEALDMSPEEIDEMLRILQEKKAALSK